MSANGGCFETMLAACDHADIGGFDHPSVGIAWSTLKAMIEELQLLRESYQVSPYKRDVVDRAIEKTDLFMNRNRDNKWWM